MLREETLLHKSGRFIMHGLKTPRSIQPGITGMASSYAFGLMGSLSKPVESDKTHDVPCPFTGDHPIRLLWGEGSFLPLSKVVGRGNIGAEAPQMKEPLSSGTFTASL